MNALFVFIAAGGVDRCSTGELAAERLAPLPSGENPLNGIISAKFPVAWNKFSMSPAIFEGPACALVVAVLSLPPGIGGDGPPGCVMPANVISMLELAKNWSHALKSVKLVKSGLLAMVVYGDGPVAVVGEGRKFSGGELSVDIIDMRPESPPMLVRDVVLPLLKDSNGVYPGAVVRPSW